MIDPTAIPEPGADAGALQRWQEAERERRAAELEAWDRRNRAIWRRGILQIIAVEWIAVALMLWSFHVSGRLLGEIAFWAALGLGDGGFLYLFVRTWRRAEGGAPS